MYMYDFESPSTKPSTQHHIFYFAGGGFQSPPSKEHWKLCAELARRLKSCQVTVVSYPLAPHTPAAKALPMLQDWLRALASEIAAKGESMTLMGDSAGANIALTLGLWWAEHADPSEKSLLKNVFAISPPTDLRTCNPEIVEADRHDPILTAKLSADVGKAWADGMELDHPDISPLFADLSLLRTAGIKCHGVVGTYDVLAPDAVKFREACEKAGVTGEWLVWEGQMHCFPLTFSYGMSEGKQGMDWVVGVLERNT
jgi:acetyl esterase/lipase